MKRILVFLLLTFPLRAQDAALPADAQRVLREYDATVDAAKKRLLQQLQVIQQSATTRGQLDAAMAVRTKITELAPGGAAAPPEAAGGDGEVVAIDAHDDKGTLLGPGRKGQRVRVAYVEGTWVVAGAGQRSPEEPTHPISQVDIIGISPAGEEVIALVPGGTKRRTFSEALKKDYTEIRLRCHDENRSDNSGIVKYKAAIR